jgi:hypothetical protein
MDHLSLNSSIAYCHVRMHFIFLVRGDFWKQLNEIAGQYFLLPQFLRVVGVNLKNK